MFSDYKELIEDNCDIVWEVNKNGVYTYVNDVVEDILGYKAKDVIGKKIFDFIHEKEKAKIKAIFEQTIENPKKFKNVENMNCHKNGSVVILETSGTPIFDVSNNIVGYRGIDRDITHKKDLQRRLHAKTNKLEEINKSLQEQVYLQTKKLHETINRYDFAIKGSNDGLWDWNIKTGEIYYSQRWKAMLGYEDDELENTFDSWSSLIHPDDYDSCMNDVDKSRHGQIDFFENIHRLKHKNGSWVWVFDKAKTFFDEEGKAIRMAGFHTDITQRAKDEKRIKEKEAILVEQSKMALMGEMLENIAHQWRQPLSVISTAATGIAIQKEHNILTDKDLLDAIEKIKDSTQYLSHTIDDFRDFFKTKKEIIVFDISDTVHKTIKLLHFDFTIINIITNIDSVEFFGLESELIQVFINILTNAKDELEIQNIDNKFIFIDVYEEGDNCIIKIKDNAGGVPKNIISKIFDPYFTTKKDNKGTGIGLHMCKEIIHNHLQGTLNVENVTYDYLNNQYTGAQFSIKVSKKMAQSNFEESKFQGENI